MQHASQPTAAGKRARRSPVVSPPSSPAFSDLQLSDELSTDTEALSPVALPTWLRSPALATAVATLPTQLTLPTLPTQPALLTQSAGATPDDTSAPFDPEECRPSRLPIFRVSDIVTRQPAADRTDREVAAFTFTQWLEYFLTHPTFAAQRSSSFSDEQYCVLLGYLTHDDPNLRVVDYVIEKDLDLTWETWLYHEITDNTYQYMVMSYRGASVNDMQIAPVLVCFKEPATQKGGKVTRRKATATTPTTGGLLRRCVPHSQIERVIHLCHTGALGSSMHLGQLATWDKLKEKYDGIIRDIVREYVKRCPVCQQQQRRQHRAALVPITAKRLFERIVIDLIDFTLKPSHGYRYIFHAVDHFSKYHWAWAIPNKESVSVAFCLSTLLADIGPVQYIQSDQGGEFKGWEVQAVLAEFDCRPINSAPYTPSTNGLVERGNGMLKSALDHWFVQESTLDWYPPLARIRYQINCNKPRTTRCTPYELVFGKKPPSWDGLEQPWPLTANTLTAVLLEAEQPVVAAPIGPAATAEPAIGFIPSAAAAVASSSSAAALLATMAVERSSQLPDQLSQLRELEQAGRISQLPDQQSQLPAQHSQLRAADSDVYPEMVYDLPPSIPGPLNSFVAEQLNVGGCHFVRLGGEGGGRCAISAFYNAVAPMDYIHVTGAERRNAFDDVRKKLREMWETLNTDTRPASAAKRRRLRDMIFEIGNSDASHDEQPDVPAELPIATPGDEQRERAWAQLGEDLHIPTKSLGPDAIAVMAGEQRINVLLYINHTSVMDYGPGTARAAQHWKDATEAERQRQMQQYKKKTAGGRWVRINTVNDVQLLPQFIVQDCPFVVLHQRTHSEWTFRWDGAKETTTTSGGTGHYEAIVRPSTDSAGVTTYSGLYRMGGDTANEYDHILSVAKRLMAVWNQQRASQQMAVYYDLKKKVHQYQMLDSVTVRIPGQHARKGDTPHTLPGLVIGVHPHKVGNGKQVEHILYTVWCQYGVLKDKLKVDRLVSLSLNNFPHLLEFIAKLTPQERLSPKDSSYQPPLTGTAQDIARITVQEAWAAHLGKQTQRVVNQKRKRAVAPRLAANAADTSIAATLADHRTGPSLSIVCNQPAFNAAARTDGQASDIACILRENKSKYLVRYTQPAANPVEQWVGRGWLDKQAAHIPVVLAWRTQQQQQQQQRSLVDAIDIADPSDWFSDSDNE